jgi:hypothetical protein
MSASIAALRQLMEQRFPDTVPAVHRTTPQLPTGSAALDRVLPGGGLPRGRLAAWAPGGGAAALLRGACRAAVARGERVAWVDATGTVGGELWRREPILVRTCGGAQALGCAEELARCGGFGLVVLGGAEGGDRERVRLSRAAQEGGTALVTLSADGFAAGVRLASWILPGRCRWRTSTLGERMDVEKVAVRVRATALGWSKEAELSLTLAFHEHRLSLEPTLGDRRGAAAR